MLGRKKTTVEATQEAWDISRGEYDDMLLLARFNSAYRRASNLTDYPIQIGVAIPLVSPDAHGMPGSHEEVELAAIEETILREAAGQAVLVGVITTKSMREFVLYTTTGDWIESFHLRLSSGVASHEIQVMAKRDPEWTVYRQFVK